MEKCLGKTIRFLINFTNGPVWRSCGIYSCVKNSDKLCMTDFSRTLVEKQPPTKQ